MIVQFSVENYFSFKEQSTLSFAARKIPQKDCFFAQNQSFYGTGT